VDGAPAAHAGALSAVLEGGPEAPRPGGRGHRRGHHEVRHGAGAGVAAGAGRHGSFGVDLEELGRLRRRLGELHALVAGSSTAYSAHGGIVPAGSIDPRVDTSAAMRRVEGAETYVYGRLEESDALGLAHRLVAESVGRLVGELGDLLDGMTAAAGVTASRYAEADGAVEGAVRGVRGALGGGS
jgi:hypothetical protein